MYKLPNEFPIQERGQHAFADLSTKTLLLTKIFFIPSFIRTIHFRTKIHKHISTKKKTSYLKPQCRPVEIAVQNVIAASTDVTNTGVANPFESLFNSEEEW